LKVRLKTKGKLKLFNEKVLKISSLQNTEKKEECGANRSCSH